MLRSILLAGFASLLAGAALAQEAPSLEGKPLPEYTVPEGGLLAEIKARGKLVNGVEAATPPYEFIKDGEIVGFDIDLSRLFAESLGVDLEVIDTNWSGVIPSLYTKKFDMIWSAMPITENRAKAVTFSPPYTTDAPIFLIRPDDDSIKSVDDFKGKRLGSQLNSSVAEQSQKLSDEKGLGMDITLYDAIATAYLDLQNGNLDIVTTSKDAFTVLDQQQPGRFKPIFELPPNLFMAVAMRKQDTDLAAAVDAFLTEIKANGTLDELSRKWFGYAKEVPAEAPQ
jgi:polar amino acid transport system substrate-binding protein